MSGAFEALADPTRRTIVERLAHEDMTAGQIASLFEVARPGVSRHLRVLREAGLVEAQAVAQRRIYRLTPDALGEVERWCLTVRTFWDQRLDALGTEIARGRRDQRQEQA